MIHALRILAGLPRRPGRFLLAPGLAGGRWLVGMGVPRVVEEAGMEALPRLLAPGGRGAVVALPYELGGSLLRRERPRTGGSAVAIAIEEAVAIDPRSGALSGDVHLARHAREPQAPLPTRAAASASLSRAGHRLAVERIHEAIRDGETYQANLTVQLAAPWEQAPEALFLALHASGPQACSAFVDLPGGAAIASASPETLLRYDAESRRAISLPIKGTRPRGATQAEDEALAAALVADPKERAEHVMIVDLVRNDLGRVASTGSVSVPALLRVDRLPTVHHLVSEIAAVLEPPRGLPDLVASLFPAGSITGAPKLRTMEIVEEVEPVPRGFYCGALGLVGADGGCALSVAIRTAVVADGRASYGAGGGITIDADPAREWEELLLKARPFLSAVGASAPC